MTCLKSQYYFKLRESWQDKLPISTTVVHKNIEMQNHAIKANQWIPSNHWAGASLAHNPEIHGGERSWNPQPCWKGGLSFWDSYSPQLQCHNSHKRLAGWSWKIGKRRMMPRTLLSYTPYQMAASSQKPASSRKGQAIVDHRFLTNPLFPAFLCHLHLLW